MANQFDVSDLAKVVGNAPTSRRFTPDTYLQKNGTVGCGVKPMGAWNSISPAVALLILSHPDEFKQAVIEAIAKSKQPGELERLQKLAAAKEAARAAKNGKPAASAAGSNADLAAMIAQLQNA